MAVHEMKWETGLWGHDWLGAWCLVGREKNGSGERKDWIALTARFGGTAYNGSCKGPWRWIRPMQTPDGRSPDVFRYAASKSVVEMAAILSVAAEEIIIELS